MPKNPQDRKPKQLKQKQPKVTLAPADDSVEYVPTAWGESKVGKEFDVTVPSGQRCRVRQMSLQDIIFKGMIDSVDLVTSTINSMHVMPKKGMSPKQIEEQNRKAGQALLTDPRAHKIFETIDKIVQMTVVAPQIELNPPDGESRRPGVIYADMVSLNDKMHIFKLAMADIEEAAEFREGSEEGVGDVRVGEGLQDSAVKASGN